MIRQFILIDVVFPGGGRAFFDVSMTVGFCRYGIGSGYSFREGADHNEITLENEDVIEGIRAYIASRNDYLIVELVDGKEPADPEGTVFECKTALYQLYPAIYKGVSTAEGKTFSFSRGEKQNRYITNDAEEIKILRDYIKTRVDNMFTEVRE